MSKPNEQLEKPLSFIQEGAKAAYGIIHWASEWGWNLLPAFSLTFSPVIEEENLETTADEELEKIQEIDLEKNDEETTEISFVESIVNSAWSYAKENPSQTFGLALTIYYTITNNFSFSQTPFNNSEYLMNGIRVATNTFAFVTDTLTKLAVMQFAANRFSNTALSAVITGTSFLKTIEAAPTTFFTMLGGSSSDYATATCLATGGGTFVAGQTAVTNFFDALLVKLNTAGDMVWARTYGETGQQEVNTVYCTSDGGVLIAGTTNGDFFLTKVNSEGDLLWVKSLGSSQAEVAYGVCETTDGSAVIVGSSNSYGAGDLDFLLAKVSSSGTLIWARLLGGSSSTEYAVAVRCTSDGGTIVVGVGYQGNGPKRTLLAKVDGNGNHLWTRTFGGIISYDIPKAAYGTPDGGTIIGGVTGTWGTAHEDFMIVKIDGNGNFVWGNRLGYRGVSLQSDCIAYGISSTNDGGTIVVGTTINFGTVGPFGGLIAKVDSNGNFVWARTLGGSQADSLKAVVSTNDGNILIVGTTKSFGAGSDDCLLAKITNAGDMANCNNLVSVSPFYGAIDSTSTSSISLVFQSPAVTFQTISLTTSIVNPPLTLQCPQPATPTPTPPPTATPTAAPSTDTPTPATVTPTAAPPTDTPTPATATPTAVPPTDAPTLPTVTPTAASPTAIPTLAPPIVTTLSINDMISIVVGVGFAAVAVTLLTVLGFLVCRKEKKKTETNEQLGNTAPDVKNHSLESESSKRSKFSNEEGIDEEINIPFAELSFSRDEDNELGSGTYGTVYRGTYQGRDVAIKKLHLTKELEPEGKTKFLKESSLMKTLSHPNIVKFIGTSVEKPGKHYLVLELVRNGSVSDLLENEKPAWNIRYRIAKDVACALEYLHQENIIHRDIKSPNVLLDENFQGKLTDFGLAFIKTQTLSNSNIVGTPQWMAPELLDLESPAFPTTQSDIYSFGMLLWELAACKTPFAGYLPLQVVLLVMNGKKETIPADTPKEFEKIIQSCWREPGQRPDASTLFKQLETLWEREEEKLLQASVPQRSNKAVEMAFRSNFLASSSSRPKSALESTSISKHNVFAQISSDGRKNSPIPLLPLSHDLDPTDSEWLTLKI